MIKQKLTNVSYLLSVSVFLLFLWSCEEDKEFELDRPSHNTHISSKIIQFDEFTRTNSRNEKTLSKSIQSLGQSKNTQTNIMVIDSTQISKIEHPSGYTSYSIPIQSDPNNNLLQNIIISQFQDGTESSYLAEYKTDLPLKEIDTESLNGHITGTRLTNLVDSNLDFSSKNNEICVDIITTTEYVCSFVDTKPYNKHPECFDKDGEPKTMIKVSIETICSGGGRSTPSPGSDGFYSSPGSYGNNGDGNSTDTGDFNDEFQEDPCEENGAYNTIDDGSGRCVTGLGSALVPRDSLLEEAAFINFVDNLEFELKLKWLDLSPEQQGEIEAFLEENKEDDEYPEEAVDFAEEVIDLWDEDPDAEVDFLNRIIEKFEGTQTDCIHEMLKTDGSNFTLYDSLLNNFNGYFVGDYLVLEVGNTGSNWGYTTGQAGVDNDIIDNPNSYNVTISNDLNENGSNLAITVTLIHEIMHAYMYQSLFDAGLIEFIDGDPVPVGNLCNLTLSLDNYTIGEIFSAYICELDQNNELDDQWSHEIFNTNIFSITSYQEQIADYIYQNHDWSSENDDFINDMINYFGQNDWKDYVSNATSWIGLTETTEYQNYIDNIDDPIVKLGFDSIADSRLFINNGNNNCN